MSALQNPARALQAVLVACGRCRCAVIHALDAPVCAFEVRLDPEPLTEIEELQALMSGRMTYDLIRVGHHHEIAYRDQWRIRKRKYPVLVTHQCPGRIPATVATRITTSTTKGDRNAPQRPPF
ncbi:hypothetical protein [Actinoallomurus iriomotensis]|uniref:Uncharacterized protein n=1 Tax=Actinoallomurus iriomotensis TaxID=478107 RepID=A0A9W6RXD9_9ACTN|nr:hypothetical protein [Actinoallomurus iriomotensis]GLY81857.1 hypothetical protein Airi01_101240 [Actinoallomurus iriomotensis]